MTLESMTVDDLLSAIGARTPTPGGGAVASLTAAIGIALARMVLGYSEGKKKLAEHAVLHAEAAAALDTLRADAIALATADAEAYARLNDLWKLPEDDERRRRDFPDAVRAAIEAPHRIAECGLDTLRLLERLVGRTNRMLASDLAIAAILAEAAVRAAVWNVRINLPSLADEADRTALAETAGEQVQEARRAAASIESSCAVD